MLARYKIYRGKRPPEQPLPDGLRQDTRKHTRHCLRPTAEIVAEYLAHPTPAAWQRFANSYIRILAERFDEDPAPFHSLRDLAVQQDVLLGCSCPTANNPDVNHCHTVLALEFMQSRYPELDVRFP